jgi:hypothetical protein
MVSWYCTLSAARPGRRHAARLRESPRRTASRRRARPLRAHAAPHVHRGGGVLLARAQRDEDLATPRARASAPRRLEARAHAASTRCGARLVPAERRGVRAHGRHGARGGCSGCAACAWRYGRPFRRPKAGDPPGFRGLSGAWVRLGARPRLRAAERAGSPFSPSSRPRSRPSSRARRCHLRPWRKPRTSLATWRRSSQTRGRTCVACALAGARPAAADARGTPRNCAAAADPRRRGGDGAGADGHGRGHPAGALLRRAGALAAARLRGRCARRG